MRYVLAAALVIVVGAPAQAKPERCMTRAIKATGAIEDPSSVMKAGATFGPITQMRVSKSNGRAIYCAHGSYCYPTSNLEFISPCAISSFPSYQDNEDSFYDPS